MDHLAIMKKSWGLTEKILVGEKKAESRWYKTKRSPWDKIRAGDAIYFKNSGELVSIKARVTKVLQFNNLTAEKTEKIMSKYGKADLGTSHIIPEIKRYVFGKNYCIIVFFDNVKEIAPFEIDKSGFGAMSAWISVDDIERLKKKRRK